MSDLGAVHGANQAALPTTVQIYLSSARPMHTDMGTRGRVQGAGRGSWAGIGGLLRTPLKRLIIHHTCTGT